MSAQVPQQAQALPGGPDTAQLLAVERYKYILQQIHALNENVYKFLAIYQTLATAIVGAGISVFLGHDKWGVGPEVARGALKGLLWLETFVAGFTMLLVVIGVLSWLDYRREECELLDELVRPGFRKPPRIAAAYRWYETYVVLFIGGSTVFLWVYTVSLLLPAIK
ncbi:hypothetical protein GCM10022221_80680 [Actinocorallia aurea]